LPASFVTPPTVSPAVLAASVAVSTASPTTAGADTVAVVEGAETDAGTSTDGTLALGSASDGRGAVVPPPPPETFPVSGALTAAGAVAGADAVTLVVSGACVSLDDGAVAGDDAPEVRACGARPARRAEVAAGARVAPLGRRGTLAARWAVPDAVTTRAAGVAAAS